MKIRDSGMPGEAIWNAFFNVEKILDTLFVNNSVTNLVEVGCGYGTFTLEAARRIQGKLFALDIELDMIEYVSNKAATEGIRNIELHNIDVFSHEPKIKKELVDYVMLFNIMHHDKPLEFLAKAYKILKSGGKVGIIHWRTDMETPRGPDMTIRPKPEQCVRWAELAGFSVALQPVILEPFHYGLVGVKK